MHKFIVFKCIDPIARCADPYLVSVVLVQGKDITVVQSFNFGKMDELFTIIPVQSSFSRPFVDICVVLFGHSCSNPTLNSLKFSDIDIISSIRDFKGIAEF